MVLFFCLTTLQNWQNCPAALTNHSGFLSIQLGFFRTSRGGANTENHGVPVRQFACGMYPPIYFEGNFKVLPGEGRDGLMQKFTSLVGALPKKAIAELMVHPAFADEVLLQSSSYNLQRVQEHSVLTDPYAAQFLRAQGIELVSFKECKG